MKKNFICSSKKYTTFPTELEYSFLIFLYIYFYSRVSQWALYRLIYFRKAGFRMKRVHWWVIGIRILLGKMMDYFLLRNQLPIRLIGTRLLGIRLLCRA